MGRVAGARDVENRIIAIVPTELDITRPVKPRPASEPGPPKMLEAAGASIGAMEDELLERCYLSCFDLVEQHGMRSVSFPAISCGAYGYPVDRAANIAMSEAGR